MSTQPGHHYRRPDWTCLACNEPWPCAVRRAAFLAKYAGEGMRLRGILGAAALDAEQDLGLDHEESHQRFIAWTISPGDLLTDAEYDGAAGRV